LTIYEIFKPVLQQRDESHALRAVAVMQQGSVVDLDARLALFAGTRESRHTPSHGR
jgi:toxin FitB